MSYIDATLTHFDGLVGRLRLYPNGRWVLFPGLFDFSKSDPSSVRVFIEEGGKIVRTGDAWISSDGTYTFEGDDEKMKLADDSSPRWEGR